MEETLLVTGPVVEVHDVLGPDSIQAGAPVGARDPPVPVMVAV